ncbi:MAG TPA: right-handed parallel beta-helix repeat-containing protein [Actinomycetota bacterium]|nr:right-handed parallel beta-helix repeat-containing protein [Actinomycetota bacterium]
MPLAATLIFAVALVGTVLVPRQLQAAHLPMCLGKQATIVGSNKANTLRGTKKADVIVGLGGNDRILGRGGGDRICGGGGKDRLFGGGGNDQMNGGMSVDDCLQEAGTGTKKHCEGPRFPLTVSKAGTGTGTVTSSPVVIDCGPNCVGQFFEGQKVTLSASAASPSTFDGWGGACTGAGPCTVVIVNAKAVTATFSTGSGGPSGPGTSPGAVSCPGDPCYVVSRTGIGYRAVAPLSARSIEDASLKLVVEGAVRDLDTLPRGDIIFTAGIFDLGPHNLRFDGISDIEFAGAGMDATVLRNASDADDDTEPFDMHDTNRVVIRDMTVNAGGTPYPNRSTSDAIDFDGGNNTVIERVKVAQSRGRGIVFDGKDIRRGVNRPAEHNVVQDCVIIGIPGDGVELLASSYNRVEGCTISHVGGNGIQITKASATADPRIVALNKKSEWNAILGNAIDESGASGINVNSSDHNTIDGNTIKNSSDKTTNGDGIKLTSTSSITCDDNVIRKNTAFDDQSPKTQNWGLHITMPNCHRTVIEPNNVLTGNLRGACRDAGTNTIKPDWC